MTALLTLGRDTTPLEFFEDGLLPALDEATIPSDVSEGCCVVRVEGTGGGCWVLGVEDGEFFFEDAADDEPVFQVTLSIGDFRELFVGSVRDKLLRAVGGADAIDDKMVVQLFSKLLLSESKASRLEQFSGDLQLAIEDRDEMMTYQITLTVGAQAPNISDPTTRAALKVEDWIEILTRKVNPQQAFMQGKIQLTGDMALPMGLISVMTGP